MADFIFNTLGDLLQEASYWATTASFQIENEWGVAYTAAHLNDLVDL